MRKFAVVESPKGVRAYELVGSKLMFPTYTFSEEEDCPEGFKFFNNYPDVETACETLGSMGKIYLFREYLDEYGLKRWAEVD